MNEIEAPYCPVCGIRNGHIYTCPRVEQAVSSVYRTPLPIMTKPLLPPPPIPWWKRLWRSITK